LNYLYRKNEKFKRLENKIHRLEYKHSNLSREEDNKDCKDNLIILNLELEKIEDKNIIKGIKWPSLEKSIIYEMLRPIEFIYEKFDLIVGNPPWIVYNSIRDLEYQEYLKHQIKDIYGLTKSSELMTHMELATLFFVKSAELYLKESGIIVFLMPKSIYSAEQHQVFRTTAFKNVKLGFYKIYDLENVKTLFKIPTCVIFAKMSSETKFPIECLIFKENFKKIKKKDIELKKDMKSEFRELVIERRQLYLSNIGKRNFFSIEKSDFKQKSYYYNKFYQGASITPRVFWCVDIKNECKIRNNGRITFSTSKQALFNAKRQWTIKIEGEVESDFLYSTILGINLFPFTYTLTPVILPIKPIGDKYEIIEAKIAADEYPLLANWLQKVEKYWNELKKSSQKTSIYFWLNYNNKLTRQNPNYKFKILYITAATNLASCVVNIKDILGPYRGFIADTGTYYFETNNKMEAYYLTAILNAPTINKLIKQFQTPGKFGKRNIHKKVLELNIPQIRK
ncbi:MAG: Eco57I restriction-modification methylase domain-containing protein, partial [Candidatus Helarchaeota archaeon]